MNSEEFYKVWADPTSPWADWVAPALFTRLHREGEMISAVALPTPAWVSSLSSGTALVIDLPGADSVRVAMMFAQYGYRPIPLFNASPAPSESTGLGLAETASRKSAIEMQSVMDAVAAATPGLVSTSFPEGAPPAFILDSRRLANVPHSEHKEVFDNRWMVFPEDLPAAKYLRSHGIDKVILVQENRPDPQEDLARVLIRLQQAGIEIHAVQFTSNGPPRRITVKAPSVLKTARFRALRLLKLIRGEYETFLSQLNNGPAGG